MYPIDANIINKKIIHADVTSCQHYHIKYNSCNQLLPILSRINIIHAHTMHANAIIYKCHPTPMLSQTDAVMLDAFRNYYLTPIIYPCITIQ